MWKLSGLRYDFPDLLVEDAAGLLPNKAIEKPLKPIIWSGQVNEVPSIFGWLSRFKKVFFVSKDKELYGRVIVGKAHTQFSDILTVQVFKGVAGSP
jgi:hypothetical protein